MFMSLDVEHSMFLRFCNYSFSPADRGTKKHVYFPYRGAFPFWFYLVPLRLVSIFLNAVRTEISCGLLPRRFCRYYYKTVLLSKKVIFQVQF